MSASKESELPSEEDLKRWLAYYRQVRERRPSSGALSLDILIAMLENELSLYRIWGCSPHKRLRDLDKNMELELEYSKRIKRQLWGNDVSSQQCNPSETRTNAYGCPEILAGGVKIQTISGSSLSMSVTSQDANPIKKLLKRIRTLLS